jgi:spore coat polysaccharide biosynthesis protein SpsF
VSAAIVLQARMASQRLPGKVLALIAGRTVLEHCVERLTASGLPVAIAAPLGRDDDAIADEGRRLGINVLRGPHEDVLGRFALAATTLRVDEIVRATADNPAVDIEVPCRTLAVRRETNADHVVEDGLPYGTTVEAMTTAALLRQAALATDPADREHVTPFMRRDSRFVAVRSLAPPHLRRPELRLTVDTPADLEFLRKVFDLAEQRHPHPVPLAALIAAAAAVADTVPSEH